MGPRATVPHDANQNCCNILILVLLHNIMFRPIGNAVFVHAQYFPVITLSNVSGVSIVRVCNRPFPYRWC
jgi:hypothetical protein